MEDWSYDFQPLSAVALPTDVFADERTLTINATTILLRYYGPAHTDSDISVYFVQEPDVLHAADTFWNGVYPFIDYSTGGSIDGSIPSRRCQPGSPPGTRPSSSQGTASRSAIESELREFRDMLVGVRANVAGLKKNGHSLEAIVAAKPTAEYDAKWGNFVIKPALFTRLAYEGI